MRIRIDHVTRYRYDEPARSVLQVLRLTPRDHDGQHVVSWRIDPSVEGRLTCDTDHFGNITHTFTADQPVGDLTLRVAGIVETADTAGVVRMRNERVPAACFLRETPLTAPDEAIKDLASAAASTHGDRLSTLHGLLLAVHDAIQFDVAPTRTGTTASEALVLGRGVCQDLTHVFLAAARVLDIPSRYVSGYFRRGDGVVVQEAGHAWAEAHIPEFGWIGFDPTNGICSTDAHVRVAVGLDYYGAAPIRGSRRGGGTEEMDVRLTVEAMQRQSQGQRQG